MTATERRKSAIEQLVLHLPSDYKSKFEREYSKISTSEMESLAKLTPFEQRKGVLETLMPTYYAGLRETVSQCMSNIDPQYLDWFYYTTLSILALYDEDYTEDLGMIVHFLEGMRNASGQIDAIDYCLRILNIGNDADAKNRRRGEHYPEWWIVQRYDEHTEVLDCILLDALAQGTPEQKRNAIRWIQHSSIEKERLVGELQPYLNDDEFETKTWAAIQIAFLAPSKADSVYEFLIQGLVRWKASWFLEYENGNSGATLSAAALLHLVASRIQDSPELIDRAKVDLLTMDLRTDRKAAERAIRRYYECLELSAPTVSWYENYDGTIVAAQEYERERVQDCQIAMMELWKNENEA